jgi:hypothetical protein
MLDGLSLPHHEEKRDAVAVQQQNVRADAMQANIVSFVFYWNKIKISTTYVVRLATLSI